MIESTEATTLYFEIQFLHFPGRTEENYYHVNDLKDGHKSWNLLKMNQEMNMCTLHSAFLSGLHSHLLQVLTNSKDHEIILCTPLNIHNI
jgi:hypothetical protein